MSKQVDSNIEPALAGTDRLRFESAGRTHVGLVRSSNEDCFLERGDVALWVVADGMGGHDAGEVASKATVQALQQLDIDGSVQERAADVEACLDEVNQDLRAMARGRGGRVIGTTVVALTTAGTDAACVWAGDSRLYRLRNGHLQQMTQDHALVQELVRIGALAPEAARNHPAANLVTRALGAENTLDPDVLFFELHADDFLILASDGLTDDALANVQLESRNGDTVDDIADALVQAALDDGGEDNVTVVCVRILAVDAHFEESGKMSEAPNET